ncbi:unnamed protein product [Adineta ricciae]|uniref:Uncharacterized protein n=2 Tax=Adineta ricciae TaxID=249248 RepID=A0A814Y506_ADIRI|nr:unnamed protein product [Adineta ricciae]
MFSTLLYLGITALFFVQNSLSEHSVGSNVGRVKYENGEVILFQNLDKPTNFFFTPFPLVNPLNSRCHRNILSGYAELSLAIDLYTSQLIQAVNEYVKELFPTLCDSNQTCHTAMVPMNVIGLVQNGLRTNETREMYQIGQEWFPNTIFLQSIHFPIYTTYEDVCERLLSSLVSDCYLSNFEVHYSLHPEKLVERQIDVTTDQVIRTAMFHQIRAQFSMTDTVVVTNHDYKQLLSEVINKINMKLRSQEGFGSSLQDPSILERLLDQQLPFKQIRLSQADDKLWNSMYRTSDSTRPDRLAKALNTILYRKNSTDDQYILLDSHTLKHSLTQHDIDRIEELGKLLATRIPSDHVTTPYIMSRDDVVTYLSNISNEIHLDSEIIVPKPIDVHLIKMNTMKIEKKLVSHSMLVRTRSDIHVLPLRCPLVKTNSIKDQYRRLEDKVRLLTVLVRNLTNQSSECHRERDELLTQMASFGQSAVKKPVDSLAIKWKPHGITVAGGNGGGNQSNQLYFPCGFFLDDYKDLIIADYWNDRIVKWNSNSGKGETIAGENGRGNRYDQLYSPRDVINEKQYNSFIICDRDNRRVMRWFFHNKEYQQMLMSDIDCWGLAMDKSGYIYVSDWKKNEVKRWHQEEPAGAIVAGGNGAGDRYDQLNYPTYIFVDEDYSIYISDGENHRVMKWTKDAKEGILVAGGNGRGNSLNQLINPRGVLVDGLGQIYIADMRNHRIVLWHEGDAEGSIIIGVHGLGNSSYQLHHPTALAFDNEENLYVADWENHRILKYEQNSQ